MSWIALELALPSSELPQIEQLLLAEGALAITLSNSDEATVELVLEPDPGQTPLWRHLRLQALFDLDTDIGDLRRALQEHARVSGEPLHDRVEIRFIADTNWQAGFRAAAIDRVFAGRLRLRPRAHRAEGPRRKRSDDLSLFLDPGLAFGSGTHPTTQLCLEEIAAHTRGRLAVLDYGCGSGVLGVAAALLGAHAVCVDHDAQALLATRQNADYNGLNDEDVVVLDTQAWSAARFVARFDIVVANILAGPLKALAVELEDALVEGGLLILSGILDEQADGVQASYRRTDFVASKAQSGWTRLMGYRRGG